MPDDLKFFGPSESTNRDQYCIEDLAGLSVVVKDKLDSFYEGGRWYRIADLKMYNPIQLALDHHVYGISLRVYYYLGTVVDTHTGNKRVAFISAKSSGCQGPPPERGLTWATRALAVYINPSDEVQYVDLTHLAILNPRPDGKVFGRLWEGQPLLPAESFKKELDCRLGHLLECHPRLYDNIWCQFEHKYGDWKFWKGKVAKTLGIQNVGGDEEQCHSASCQVVPRLAEALERSRHAGENNNRRGHRKVPSTSSTSSEPEDEKARPSKELCDFLSGMVEPFRAHRHNLCRVGKYTLPMGGG